jgi:hypothetical protein
MTYNKCDLIGHDSCPKIALQRCSVFGQAELLTGHFMVMLVTHEEHTRLNASGLRSQMPREWDGSDILARYAAVGISIANNRSFESRTG